MKKPFAHGLRHMKNIPRAIFGLSQSDLLFLISPRLLFPAFPPSVEDRYDREEVLFPWRKVDVVEQFRLPKPCTGPNTHTQTHRHPATLPPGVLDLHPPRPSPEGGKKQTGASSPRSFFSISLVPACLALWPDSPSGWIAMIRREKRNPDNQKENQESNGGA